ncbi:MAG: HAMP domain-containing protein [Rhodoferax sp.]|nr:HAMP domain-containing protein [Rhodoferax sp.]
MKPLTLITGRGRWHRRVHHALTHSLRVRLMALFLLLAVAMAGVFVGGMQLALALGWRDAARPLVHDYVDRLTAEIGTPPDTRKARELVERLPLSVRISGPVVNWNSHPQEQERTHDRWIRSEDSAPRVFDRYTSDGHRIRFSLRMSPWHDRPHFIGWVTLAVLLALTALAYGRVRRMLRPLDDIRTGALRFGAGDFSQPITLGHAQRPDELHELAATINTMGADIHQMLEAKRALLLAISHELRSPLTRARLHTELLPETPDVQACRDALLRDLALMRDLITDLLESERLASPHVALQRESVDLAALVQDVLTSLPGAAVVQQHFSAELPQLALDASRMRLLLRNLLDNALRHGAGVDSPPTVALEPLQDGGIQLTVRDRGPGVTDEQLTRLGQPFYRPDAARSREGGGVGLGLYLCRLVVSAHGGQWVVRRANPGLEICVTLPPAAA